MSRLLKPMDVPSGITITVNGQNVSVKGSKGTADYQIHPSVEMIQEGDSVRLAPRDNTKNTFAMVGTMRSLVSNMITGVSAGFEKKLELVGVGYRAQSKGNVLNLTLGFSHPIDYEVPAGITIETPSQTEVVVKGTDKQLVGQVAAEIRSYRPPEPYKGKGVKYADERIIRKEAKKK